jgi:2-C-methyl-D-erythritol 2,4-cyclodiphosphate synthase
MIKIGHSTDIHRLKKGRELILGGVKFDHEMGLVGHSDADVLTHAVTESIIGALGLGDIGTLFPDNDNEYKDIDSLILLRKVIVLMEQGGFRIMNIDCTIYAQEPKINPRIFELKEVLSKNMNILSSQINVKATTGEKIGFIGRKEGIAAESVVLISND